MESGRRLSLVASTFASSLRRIGVLAASPSIAKPLFQPARKIETHERRTGVQGASLPPVVAGVIALWEGAKLTYRGRAESVRGQLEAFACAHDTLDSRRVTTVTWEAHPNPQAREAELHAEYVAGSRTLVGTYGLIHGNLVRTSALSNRPGSCVIARAPFVIVLDVCAELARRAPHFLLLCAGFQVDDLEKDSRRRAPLPRDPKLEIVHPDVEPLSDLRVAVVVDYLGNGLYVQLPIVTRHADSRSQATYLAAQKRKPPVQEH